MSHSMRKGKGETQQAGVNMIIAPPGQMSIKIRIFQVPAIKRIEVVPGKEYHIDRRTASLV